MDNTFTISKMPKLIYGTAWKKEQTASFVIKAIQNGFRGIDTACQPKHYYEAGVGEALIELQSKGVARNEIFLQTKFTPFAGQDPNNIPYDPNAPIKEQVMQSFTVSQKNLKTDYVDALILHSPLSHFEETMVAWEAMQEIHQQAGTRYLGISNCYDLEMMQQLYKDAKIKPFILQNRFYRQTGYDKSLRKWCLENNIIYQSFWTLTANPDILQSATVLEIASSHKKTPAQILFRYLTQMGVMPLTGTTSQAHMLEDLAIVEFELSEIDLNKIHDLLV